MCVRDVMRGGVAGTALDWALSVLTNMVCVPMSSNTQNQPQTYQSDQPSKQLTDRIISALSDPNPDRLNDRSDLTPILIVKALTNQG